MHTTEQNTPWNTSWSKIYSLKSKCVGILCWWHWGRLLKEWICVCQTNHTVYQSNLAWQSFLLIESQHLYHISPCAGSGGLHERFHTLIESGSEVTMPNHSALRADSRTVWAAKYGGSLLTPHLLLCLRSTWTMAESDLNVFYIAQRGAISIQPAGTSLQRSTMGRCSTCKKKTWKKNEKRQHETVHPRALSTVLALQRRLIELQ